MVRFLGLYVLSYFLLFSMPMALAAGAAENKTARYGSWVEIASAPCIVDPPGRNVGTLLYKGTDAMKLLFQPSLGQTGTAVVIVDSSSAETADKQGCLNPTSQRYEIAIADPQTLNDATLSTVFKVLVSVLALSILLESAFELLFNWRFFQTYFVGKAWRSPIMFGISLLVAWQFKIDVIGPVFDAYRGHPEGTSGGGVLTSVLTAMILGGGSEGINRIMQRLNIRSPFPKADEERPRLSDSQAYLSVAVKKAGRDAKFLVNLLDEPLDPALPATLGIAFPGRARPPGSVFFPISGRVPPSGGLTISIDKTYRFSVVDLETGHLYDITGKQINSQVEAVRMRFAPRAFIDLYIVLT